MTSFVQVFGSSQVKFNLRSNPRFWRHGVILGESSGFLFFDDKLEGQVAIQLDDIKEILLEVKKKDVVKRDIDG